MDPTTIAVRWPIDAPRLCQLDVVPDLLRWTRWDEADHAWADLRRRLASSATVVSYAALPRHLRLAQILDFVGQQHVRSTAANKDPLVVCQEVAARYNMGQLEVVTDPDSGSITDVRGY